MDLHEHQQEAIDRMGKIALSGGTLLIKGKAGTGKSTVVERGLKRLKEVAPKRNIIACAFTNKAVGRMKEIGFPKDSCMTGHQLMYQTTIFFRAMTSYKALTIEGSLVTSAIKVLRKKGEAYAAEDLAPSVIIHDGDDVREECLAERIDAATQFLREVSKGSFDTETQTILRDDFNASDIILVDEVGMMPLDIMNDIIARYDTVIMMGDHRQLEPVDGEDTINVIEPDLTVELTKVFRSDSDVIKWADAAETDTLGVLPPISLKENPHVAGDDWQSIVFTNNDVFWVCHGMRTVKGISGRPQPGEPLISLKKITAINKIKTTREKATRGLKEYRDQLQYKMQLKNRISLLDDAELEALKNLKRIKPPYTIESIPENPDEVWMVIKKPIFKNEMFKATGPAFEFDGDVYIGIDLGDGKEWYVETVKFWSMSIDEYKLARKVGTLGVFFSYAITAHRSQGSEFENVLIQVRDKISEAWMDSGDDQRPRWNYTAITRAKNQALLCSRILP